MLECWSVRGESVGLVSSRANFLLCVVQRHWEGEKGARGARSEPREEQQQFHATQGREQSKEPTNVVKEKRGRKRERQRET